MILIKTEEMLGKLMLLTTFCGLLFGEAALAQMAPWRRIDVKAVIGTGKYLLEDGRQLELLGVNGVDLIHPKRNEACLTKNIDWFLKDFLLGQPTLVRINEHHQGHIKIDTQNLSETLLRNGWATLTDSDHYYGKIYKSAESLAQQTHNGRWGQCDPHLPIVKWKKSRGRTEWFWDRYHPYLGTVAVGRVVEVVSGNEFILENGLRIELENIQIGDDTEFGQCFGRVAKDYLESLILGHEVRLSEGDEFIAQYKTLVRQVELPATRWRSAIDINVQMRVDGYSYDQEHIVLDGAWIKCVKPLIAAQ